MGYSEPDEELVRLVQQGDRQAFDLLVQKYQFRIIKLVTRYVHDPAEAMDVAQESFIKAYKALERFRGDSAFYTWLYRIAINTAKNHVVAQAKRGFELNVEIIDIDQTLTKFQLREFGTPEKIMLNEEIEQAVLSVIEHLPKDLRTAIMLREREGLTYEEIAGVMACPIGTVRSRIFRAREVIERKIRPMLEEE
jgi:RNA polymerase sigma-70 factor, ECF subfamily